MQNRSMSVLVVGGAGYIGSHVCKALKEAGYLPVVFDDFSTGHSWAVRYGPLWEANVEEEKEILKALQELQPVAVCYLASLINVRDALMDPGLYYRKNLNGALSLLQAMGKANVNRLIFSSTAAVYGVPHVLPIPEEHPKAPLNAYGKSKWAIEGMLEDFAHAKKLRFVTLRYFNACGADASGEIGEAHTPETHLIPRAIQAALQNGPPLPIYGNAFPTKDGSAIRDYVHVSDLAQAHLLALQYLLDQRPNISLNLGTGSGYSVQEILRALENLLQKPIPTQLFTPLPQDTPILVADFQKAQATLGWEPRLSSLVSILSTAWRWEEKKNTHIFLKKNRTTELKSSVI